MADLVLGLAKSAVEGTLTMAKSAVEEEKKLKKAVQRNLMLISDEFEMMHSFLNASQEHITDNVARTVVRQVRNMALDMEDCIESVVHLDGKSNWWRRMLPSCMPSAAPGADLDAAVTDIEVLKARLEAMGQRNLCYNRIADTGSKPTGLTYQQAATNVTTSDILVMVKEVMEKKKHSKRVDLAMLINKKDTHPRGKKGEEDADDNDDEDVEKEYCDDEVKEEDKEMWRLHSSPPRSIGFLQLKVISVLGTRTDLGMMSIKKAYDDPETCKNFRCRAWVKLMHPFNPREFIRSFLTQFYTNYCPQEEVDALEPTKVMVATDGLLIEEFKKQMSNHKYLVVLEDVSTMVDWEAIRVYLPNNNNGSCIVVHTQQIGIASLCVGHPHQVSELEKFSADHSVYAFFKQDASGENEDTDNKLNVAAEWLDNHHIVGREMDLSKLSCTRFHGRVVSVWGMSGVGKSFLVKHFYYDHQWSSHVFGWVDVSHPFNLMDLSWNLLLDLNPRYLQHGVMPTVKDPIQACREYLHKHTYFIVIDGLQSIEEWSLIKAALELGTSSEDCIIVITNEESVAKHCASDSDSLRNVKGLGVDNAIELFEQKVERQTTIMNEEERRILVHKCGGLPKVICAAANILSRSWLGHDLLLKENLVSVLEANALHITESLDYLFEWLLSYFRSCPDFLKPCIFYLSIFPLNNTIRRRRLVRRWIAEGYARDNIGSTAEENGEMCFSKLVELSMIQLPGNVLDMRTAPLCQTNGFFCDYIISRSMEENLVFALEGHCRKNLHRTGRHLAINKAWDRDRNVFESIDFSRLRSLTVIGEWKSFFISENMRLLRVLDLEDATSGVTNGDVKKMVQLLPRLKFISLRRCREISQLPDSLGDLKQLQTLDIRETSVTKLPKSIIKLEKLQYVRGGTTVQHQGRLSVENQSTSTAPTSRPRTTPVSCLSKSSIHDPLHDDPDHHNGFKVPRGIGKLSNLHTLGVVSISDAGEDILEELKNLTQLHKLGVSGINQNNSKILFSTISNLAHLESLSLQVQLHADNNNQDGCLDGISEKTIKNLRSLKLYRLISKLPVWIKKLQGLIKLSLQITILTQEGIDILLGLPKLKNLRLPLLHKPVLLSMFQDDELHFGRQGASGFSLAFLEISCNSRLQATITFHDTDTYCMVRILRFRCWRVSSLRISGLQNLIGVQEVWLSGPCDDAHKQHFESELDKYPQWNRGSKPVLMLEEPDSSTPWLRTSS
ncbi:unnamed protein product [Urochloa decumbens]|uniref:Uncharacterized protein n=1 Tax=Urochloa decumbens TaxID=240449 RepID=A0ABC9AX72_9POAL